jgi:hypothetical protein
LHYITIFEDLASADQREKLSNNPTPGTKLQDLIKIPMNSKIDGIADELSNLQIKVLQYAIQATTIQEEQQQSHEMEGFHQSEKDKSNPKKSSDSYQTTLLLNQHLKLFVQKLIYLDNLQSYHPFFKKKIESKIHDILIGIQEQLSEGSSLIISNIFEKLGQHDSAILDRENGVFEAHLLQKRNMQTQSMTIDNVLKALRTNYSLKQTPPSADSADADGTKDLIELKLYYDHYYKVYEELTDVGELLQAKQANGGLDSYIQQRIMKQIEQKLFQFKHSVSTVGFSSFDQDKRLIMTSERKALIADVIARIFALSEFLAMEALQRLADIKVPFRK